MKFMKKDICDISFPRDFNPCPIKCQPYVGGFFFDSIQLTPGMNSFWGDMIQSMT